MHTGESSFNVQALLWCLAFHVLSPPVDMECTGPTLPSVNATGQQLSSDVLASTILS